MLVTIIGAALLVDLVFGLAGLVPTGPRPTRTDVFGSVGLELQAGAERGRDGDLPGPVLALARHIPATPRVIITILTEQGQEKRESDPAGV